MSRRGWFLFISLSIIWGLPYLLIKISVEEMSPFFVVFGRVALAAVIMLPYAYFTGQLRGIGEHWKWILLFAIVEMTFPFGAITIAEQTISSSLAGLLVAAVPLVGAMLAWRLGLDDRITKGRLVGLLIGIAGVAALVGLDVRGGDLFSVALVAITVIGYAIGPIIVAEKLSDAPSGGVIALSVTINAVIYAPLAVAFRPTETVSGGAWLSLGLLGLICTAIAFIVFFALVAEVGPARTTVITYLNPAVAVVLGVLILSEPVTLGILIGFPLVILGSFFATRKGNPIEDQAHA